jgi:hypothetical protein
MYTEIYKVNTNIFTVVKTQVLYNVKQAHKITTVLGKVKCDFFFGLKCDNSSRCVMITTKSIILRQMQLYS